MRMTQDYSILGTRDIKLAPNKVLNADISFSEFKEELIKAYELEKDVQCFFLPQEKYKNLISAFHDNSLYLDESEFEALLIEWKKTKQAITFNWFKEEPGKAFFQTCLYTEDSIYHIRLW
jgi:hypothetical protein